MDMMIVPIGFGDRSHSFSTAKRQDFSRLMKDHVNDSNHVYDKINSVAGMVYQEGVTRKRSRDFSQRFSRLNQRGSIISCFLYCAIDILSRWMRNWYEMSRQSVGLLPFATLGSLTSSSHGCEAFAFCAASNMGRRPAKIERKRSSKNLAKFWPFEENALCLNNGCHWTAYTFSYLQVHRHLEL